MIYVSLTFTKTAYGSTSNDQYTQGAMAVVKSRRDGWFVFDPTDATKAVGCFSDDSKILLGTNALRISEAVAQALRNEYESRQPAIVKLPG